MFHPGRTKRKRQAPEINNGSARPCRDRPRNADVVGLTPGQAGQFDAEVVQVQARHLLVEVFRQAVDADRVLLRHSSICARH